MAAVYDLVEHLHRQIPFSERTFGPTARTHGIIDHIRKELNEIEQHPGDLEEWIDVALLAFDGAWRCLRADKPEEIRHYSPEDVANMLRYKLEKNIERNWPDWREVGQDKAIEHDRSGE